MNFILNRNRNHFLSRVLVLFSAITLVAFQSYSNELTLDAQKANAFTQNVNLIFNLDAQEYLLKDSINVTVDNPNIKLGVLKPSRSTRSFYDPAFNTLENTIEGYDNIVQFGFVVEKEGAQASDQANLIITFRTTARDIPYHKEFALNFNTLSTTIEKDLNSSSSNALEHPLSSNKAEKNLFSRSTYWLTNITSSWINALKSLFSTTGSRFTRYLVTFIIGVLLSLTPCIYPMIPVTVGIIQASGTSSLLGNFIVALFYTLGVATTFATFGLVTALGGAAFGPLQSSPWFVIPLVAVLTYLGLAMFGLYEMYIPRFLQPKSTTTVKKGSPLSAFIFGMISGTVASPCLSPGLALVLSFVIELGKTASALRYIESFALLFIFGIGSSMPLLLIGTFSNSFKVLPQAGMWMIEVKKLLGLMLLGMCFYYLRTIITWHILLWILAAFILMLSVYYFITVKSYDSKGMKIYKNFMALFFMIMFFLISIKGYKATYSYLYEQEDTSEASFWVKNYNQATQQAQQEKKYLFLDFGTQYCPSCKSLEANVLLDPRVQPLLTSLYIPVKVDATNPQSEPYNTIKNYIRVIGFPTIVIFDAENNNVIKEWVGSVPEIPEFIVELKQLSTTQ